MKIHQCIALFSATILGLVFTPLTQSAQATPPNVLFYEGTLLLIEDDSPVNDATVMWFRIYDAEGTPAGILWSEQQSVDVADGRFVVALGADAQNPMEPSLFDGPIRYLGITVGDDPNAEELEPRQPIGGAPFALLSNNALTCDFAEQAGSLSTNALSTVANQLLSDPAYADLRENLRGEPGLACSPDDVAAALAADPSFLAATEGPQGPPGPGLESIDDSLITSLATIQYISSNTPLVDPQNGAPLTSSIQITENGLIGSVRIGLNVTHADVTELRILLSSPAGTTVVLHNYESGSDQDISTTFPDTRQPSQGSMSDFDGENVSGTWTLTLQDSTAGNVTTLNSWTLDIEYKSSDHIEFLGDVVLRSGFLTGLQDPEDPNDAANKRYVDEQVRSRIPEHFCYVKNSSHPCQTGFAEQTTQFAILVGYNVYNSTQDVSVSFSSPTNRPQLEVYQTNCTNCQDFAFLVTYYCCR